MDLGETQPWAVGPKEILEHGLGLLNQDTDTSRRLAMIMIDNAVELMISTYLSLPKSVTNLQIGMKTQQDIFNSFPKMLETLNNHASDKLNNINLGHVEWYHRLRNRLYHDGNGVTVSKEKVERYAEMANVLFMNLFGVKLVPHPMFLN